MASLLARASAKLKSCENFEVLSQLKWLTSRIIFSMHYTALVASCGFDGSRRCMAISISGCCWLYFLLFFLSPFLRYLIEEFDTKQWWWAVTGIQRPIYTASAFCRWKWYPSLLYRWIGYTNSAWCRGHTSRRAWDDIQALVVWTACKIENTSQITVV